MNLQLVSDYAIEKTEDICQFVSTNLPEDQQRFDSREEIWSIAREYEDIPNIDNIFYNLLYHDFLVAVKNFVQTPNFAKTMAYQYIYDSNEKDIRMNDAGLVKLHYLLGKDKCVEFEDEIISGIQEYLMNHYNLAEIFENDVDVSCSINDGATSFDLNGEEVICESVDGIESVLLNAFLYDTSINLENIVDYVAKEKFNLKLDTQVDEKDEYFLIVTASKIDVDKLTTTRSFKASP